MNLSGINRFTRVKPVSQYRRINYFFVQQIWPFFQKTREKRFGAGKPVKAAFQALLFAEIIYFSKRIIAQNEMGTETYIGIHRLQSCIYYSSHYSLKKNTEIIQVW